MNKQQLLLFYKLLSFTLLFFVACGFQTSFWPNVISFLPSPQIWLIILLYISIKWKSTNFIFFIYFLSYCLTFFADIPLKMLWCTLAVTYFIIITVKNRIHLSGVLSFILFTLAGSFLFEIGYYLFSDILEATPTSFMFIDRLLQILMNFIFSYPIYFLLDFVDRATQIKEDWRDSSVRNNQHEQML
ncbi:MAG: hypothetical protein ACXVAX_04650 [Pseudobdellovibrio sp.]